MNELSYDIFGDSSWWPSTAHATAVAAPANVTPNTPTNNAGAALIDTLLNNVGLGFPAAAVQAAAPQTTAKVLGTVESTYAVQTAGTILGGIGNSVADAIPSKSTLFAGAGVLIVVLILILLMLGKVENL